MALIDRAALLLISGAIASLLCCPALAAEPDREAIAYFETHVRPVLADHCVKCHGPRKSESGLRLDQRSGMTQGGDSGPAVIPGDPAKSLLIKAIRHEDGLAMPPQKQLDPLQIAALERWIKDGAVWPEGVRLGSAGVELRSGPITAQEREFWSLQSVKNPAPPEVPPSVPVRNAIDRFIHARLAQDGLTMRAAADKLTLLRRATFDLTGLPPAPDDIAAFLADSSPSAFENVVERLLASPAYGERWGRHWLDVVRYADTAGETADYPVPLAWRYRNYVIDSFNADKPYDEFLREQIAGDVLARQGERARYAEQVTATGFLAISRRFGFDSENYHHLTIQDTIDTLGQTVLGLSLGCARCHDHKFDPVSMRDYYALYGIFDSTRYAFPGSEQKQKVRVMLPLVPPSESHALWRQHEERVAELAQTLARHQQPMPAAVLRSLDEMDGDFELQAPAAGGSQGVLVLPWLYEGPIAVTTGAQSPFRNVYGPGRVGVHIPAGAGPYRIQQALRTPVTKEPGDLIHFNVDFRIAAANADSEGAHRFTLGSLRGEPAMEILVAPEKLSLMAGGMVIDNLKLQAGQWQNLQLTLDLHRGMVAGRVGKPGQVAEIRELPLSAVWSGTIDCVRIDAWGGQDVKLPGLELDNLAVEQAPLGLVSTEPMKPTDHDSPDPQALTEQLQALTGIDGDFELQVKDQPPASPWNPGPNSVVKVSADSQSPFLNVYPAGELGIHMPNRGEYDGFGLTFPSVRPDSQGRLWVNFEFRFSSQERGGDGSWRYYLGHGPGNSAAIELFFSGKEFVCRSGDAREPVAPLAIGEWYQVQLALDLKQRKYSGVLASKSDSTAFQGQLCSGWDGVIDYSFIDSYGHLGGIRPALDADNFSISDRPLPPLDATPLSNNADALTRRKEVTALRRQLAALRTEADQARQELAAITADGPFAMTYGVTEGTPHHARIHLRGEPSQLGAEVARGFLEVLGGGPLPPETTGSGRLELAEWISRPDNPLVARVMINRIWQHHFGRGLVGTENDFGTRGERPSHPELLDWLAARFVASGWSIKEMHRLIMASATYQQSGQYDAKGAEIDPDARLLWRYNRRRLSAEELRDAMLLVSGDLDTSQGGAHPFPAAATWGFTQHAPYYGVYESDRRSIYLMQQRLKRHPFLGLFDGADTNVSTARRQLTTVPTQALFLMNNEFVHARGSSLARRWLTAGAPTDARINDLFLGTLGRPAAADEIAEARQFVEQFTRALTGQQPAGAGNEGEWQQAAWSAFARTLLVRNEFLFVD